MVQSRAASVADYLAELPADRRPDIDPVRRVILGNLPQGVEESMQFGMIGYCIPLSRYPQTYNGSPLMLAALAAQKRHNAVYLHTIYCDPSTEGWFTEAYRATGKRMDIGKSCVRYRKVDDLPLDLIGEAIRRVGVDEYVAIYERSRGLTV